MGHCILLDYIFWCLYGFYSLLDKMFWILYEVEIVFRLDFLVVVWISHYSRLYFLDCSWSCFEIVECLVDVFCFVDSCWLLLMFFENVEMCCAMF